MVVRPPIEYGTNNNQEMSNFIFTKRGDFRLIRKFHKLSENLIMFRGRVTRENNNSKD